jgi:hypothetical protein
MLKQLSFIYLLKAFGSEAIFEPIRNKDLSTTAQSSYIATAKLMDLYVCMLQCSNNIGCVSIRFEKNECKMFNSVKTDYFIDSIGTFIYRRKKALGLNLGYDKF